MISNQCGMSIPSRHLPVGAGEARWTPTGASCWSVDSTCCATDRPHASVQRGGVRVFIFCASSRVAAPSARAGVAAGGCCGRSFPRPGPPTPELSARRRASPASCLLPSPPPSHLRIFTLLWDLPSDIPVRPVCGVRAAVRPLRVPQCRPALGRVQSAVAA